MSCGRVSSPVVAGLALALGGCSPVGPDYFRPAAIVPAHYKEIKGWKLGDAARRSSPRASGGGSSAILNSIGSRRRSRSPTRRCKADEANYREALALIAEARARPLSDDQFQSVARPRETGTQLSRPLDAEATGAWTLDIWGKVRRADRRAGAGAQVSAADLANATLVIAVGARARLYPGARGRFAARSARRHGRPIPALARHHAEPIQRGHGRASPTSSPRRRWCWPPRRRRSTSAWRARRTNTRSRC